MNVVLADLNISLCRTTTLPIPHEITVIIPRVEILRRYDGGQMVEEQINYNSVTVVHAPRGPLATERLPGTESGQEPGEPDGGAVHITVNGYPLPFPHGKKS